MHINLNDGILRRDDTPLGDHVECSFVRGNTLHSPDEDSLRAWAKRILDGQLSDAHEALHDSKRMIGERIDRLSTALANIEELR